MIHTVYERSGQATIESTTTTNGRRRRRRNIRRSDCITTRLTPPDTKTTQPIPVAVVVVVLRRRRRHRITTCQVVIDVDARRTYVKTTTSPAQQQQQRQQLLTSLRRRRHRKQQQRRRRRRHTTTISSRRSERSVYWNGYARCRQTTDQTYRPVLGHRRPNVETIRPNRIEKFPLCGKMCQSLNAAVLYLMGAKIVHLDLKMLRLMDVKMFRPDPEVFRPARLETYRRSAAYRPARRERNAHDESIIAAATSVSILP